MPSKSQPAKCFNARGKKEYARNATALAFDSSFVERRGVGSRASRVRARFRVSPSFAQWPHERGSLLASCVWQVHWKQPCLAQVPQESET